MLDRKSISEGAMPAGRAAAAWKPVKQPCISLPAAEPEHAPPAEAVKEAAWMKGALHEAGRAQEEPAAAAQGGAASIAKASEGEPKRSKRVAKLKPAPTKEMAADVMIRPLQGAALEKGRCSLPPLSANMEAQAGWRCPSGRCWSLKAHECEQIEQSMAAKGSLPLGGLQGQPTPDGPKAWCALEGSRGIQAPSKHWRCEGLRHF